MAFQKHYDFLLFTVVKSKRKIHLMQNKAA